MRIVGVDLGLRSNCGSHNRYAEKNRWFGILICLISDKIKSYGLNLVAVRHTFTLRSSVTDSKERNSVELLFDQKNQIRLFCFKPLEKNLENFTEVPD